MPAAKVVCHLIASNSAGGPEKQIVEHCTRLARLGWRAVVGSFRENRPRVEILDNARERGLSVFWIDTRSPFSPAAVWQLRRALTEFGVQVLVTHGYKADLVGSLASRRSSAVQIPFVRGYTWEDRRVRLYEQINRWQLRRFPRLVCVSEGTRSVLATYGVDPSRVEVVHNAVDCERVAPISCVDLHAEFDLPAGAHVIVAAGRLSPEKGHRDLVKAMRLLADHEPPLYLVILGAGREEMALRAQIGAAGLTDRVHLAGFRADIPKYLAGADLVVNPSLTEGLPNVILEAFSVRKPVVATNVGGVKELVLPGETGWLVPPADPAAMAAAIADVIRNPALAARFGSNGWRHVSARFGFAEQAERLATIYEGALVSLPPRRSRISAASHNSLESLGAPCDPRR